MESCRIRLPVFKVGFCRRLRKGIAAYYYGIVIMASMSSMSMAYNKEIPTYAILGLPRTLHSGLKINISTAMH